MDAYWARLKKHIRNASTTYSTQDNVDAAKKAKLLEDALHYMEALDASDEAERPSSTPDAVIPDIEELRRKFLEDDAA
jgi:hypothetical protein